jgi:hypothetical protein
MEGVILSPLTRTGTHLRCRLWLKRSLESRDEQTELLRQLVANSAHGCHGTRNASAPAPTTYNDFTATHPLLFTEAGEPLEVDHWLRVIESKFGLLHYTEVQKTLFAV